MALAQTKTENDLHTPITHYEILTEKLKDARIDRLEEVLTEKFNTVNERINSTNERINSTNERIDATRNELLVEMKSTNTRIDAIRNELNTRIDALDEKVNTRVDALDEKLTEKLQSVNTRINSLEKSNEKGFRNLGITIGIVGLGFVLLQIVLQIFFK